MEQIIECNNLTHYYGKRLIYENLSFTVPKGRILGLLGKNGTGKTTLAKVIAGATKAEFVSINATAAGKKDMEAVVEQAKNSRRMRTTELLDDPEDLGDELDS